MMLNSKHNNNAWNGSLFIENKELHKDKQLFKMQSLVWKWGVCCIKSNTEKWVGYSHYELSLQKQAYHRNKISSRQNDRVY